MREVNIIRDIEKGLQHTWRRRITSLKLNSHCSHTLLHMAAGLLPLAAPLSLLFSTGFLSPSAQFALLSYCLFIGKNGATSSSSSLTMVAANSSSSSTMVTPNL